MGKNYFTKSAIPHHHTFNFFTNQEAVKPREERCYSINKSLMTVIVEQPMAAHTITQVDVLVYYRIDKDI